MSNETQRPEQQSEPSVLDYFKSLFRFGGERITFGDQPLAVDDEPPAIGNRQLVVGEEPEESQPETFNRLSLALAACFTIRPDRTEYLRAASHHISAWDCVLHRGIRLARMGDLSRRMDSRISQTNL